MVNVPRKEVVLRERDTDAPASTPKNAGDDGGENAVGDDAGGGGPGWGPRMTSSPAVHAPAARGHGVASMSPTGTERERRPADSGHLWTAWLAAGELDRVLADAERRGIGGVLARAPAVDLAVLADAARYRRRDELARRALLTERSRFPGSPRARDAAFLLGRLEDDRPEGGSRAIRWYDRYLEEAPTGGFASEALGRKMTATERTRGIEPTRDVAQEYLRRFPEGSYAKAARAFVERR